MLKSLTVSFILMAAILAAPAAPALAGRTTCAMPITKGGCPVVVYLPDQPHSASHD